MNTDPAGVIASPVWRKFRRTDLDFLAEYAGLRSKRFQLDEGWSFEFRAFPASIEYPDGSRAERYPLERVLTLFFKQPNADPRAQLSDCEPELSPY